MGIASHQLLAPALEAARRALRELDDHQIPADLRRVAGHSGALPPPLAGALLKGIDRYEWLREKALDLWPEADPDGSGPEAVAAEFLARRPGWVARIADMATARSERDAAAGAAADAASLDSARRENRMLKDRLKSARSDADRRVAELRRVTDEERRRRRALQAEAARAEASRREASGTQAQDLAAARGRIGELMVESARLRDEARRERSRRAEAEAALIEASGRGGWSSTDPEDLAIRLDQMAAVARPPVADGGVVGRAADPTASPTGLPAGIRPDRAEAIEWLLGEAPPATVLVDGYNAGFAMCGVGDPGPVRQRLELEVGRLVTLAVGRLAMVVVYDSDRGEPEAEPRPGGVKILFASGRSADDVLVDLASAFTGRRVVITNDRAVRERVEALGATGLWSDALAAWSTRS